MSTSGERVFVVGATGNIGSDVVRGLVKKGVKTTAYVRDEKKGRELFSAELNSGYLSFAVGDYASIDAFGKAIAGHSRLFLLAAADAKKPISMAETKGTFARIAYEKGVRQIVDLSSYSVRCFGRQGIIGYLHTSAEERLWALAEEKPQERSLVVLRPAAFMSNHFMGDVRHVKHSNKLVGPAHPSGTTTWIDTKDIGESAAAILSEPVEKHDRCVYEMGGQTLSNEERAKIFSRVLGRAITYEQQSIESFYQTYIAFGMAHSMVYDILSFSFEPNHGTETPQLSVLLGRPVRKLEDWLGENIKAFEENKA